MEIKYLKIFLIILIIIGFGITSMFWSIVDYTLSYWPPSSEKGFTFIGYSVVTESTILFIILPTFYLFYLRKEKSFVQEENKIGYCNFCGADIVDKAGEFCSKCGASLI